jgi:hypothetical protein
MARLLNIFEILFLFVFMHQMVQGDQLSKIFSAVLDHPPLTATSIYSNNQSKLLYMEGVTICSITLGIKIKKNLKNSYLRPQSYFTLEMGIVYFFVKIAAS